MRKKSLRLFIGIASIASLFALASCNVNTNQAPLDMPNNIGNMENNPPFNEGFIENAGEGVEGSIGSAEISLVDENVNQGDFIIETSDGAYTVENNIYKITRGGTYTLSGSLDGQIYVMVSEANDLGSYDVTLELNGVTINYDLDSPMYIAKSSNEEISYNVDISAKSGTQNIINDNRVGEVDETLGSAAIYSLVDLKLKGKGELYVNTAYNNGIHTKDDLEIKNLTLVVNALNNAVKGNDSISIESGNLVLISTGGDGLKTTNTGLSTKGNQKGSIEILGGNVSIYSACDGIDAAYDANISGDAKVTIYTSNYSSYSGEVVSGLSETLYLRVNNSSSYRYSAYYYDNDGNGVWVDAVKMNTSSMGGRNSYSYYTIDVPSGYTNVMFYMFNSSASNSLTEYVAKSDGGLINTSYDMVSLSKSGSSLSCSYSTYSTNTQGGGMGSFGPGAMNGGNTEKSEYSAKGIKADNAINITGGEITITAYDDGLHANNENVIESTSSNGAGSIYISSGSVTIYASDDGIHADNQIEISNDAYINITYSWEGIEGNQIIFDGGTTYVYGKDDAVNAAKSGVTTTPAIYIKSGYIDLDSESGDTDTLDSNGNIYMTGGVVVLKNRQSQATSMTGGTIDLDGSFSMTGGILMSFGTWCNEVNMTADKSSTGTVSSGTYTIKDSSGNTVCQTNLAKNYTGYRLFNKTSDSYTIYLNDQAFVSF